MALPDVRSRSLTAPHTAAASTHLIAAWSLYLVLAIGATRTPMLLRLPMWIVMAWLLVGNGAIVHETTHRHLFRAPSANRWIGALAGASVLMPWGVYRAYHLAHHRNTVALDDPEGPPLLLGSRLEYPALTLGGLAFLVRLHGYGIATAARRPPTWMRSRSQRLVAVADTALCLLVLVGILWAAFVDVGTVLAVWLVPWLIALMILVPLVLVTEHYGATVGTVVAAENTRTIVSNRAVRWLYWNNNFHTAHHQLPAAVYQELPHLDAQIAGQGPDGDRGDWIFPSYFAFHRSVWAALPWVHRSADPPQVTV
jgi:fatty acid desaturase